MNNPALRIMTDMSALVDIFQGTVFYVLIGISTIVTSLQFGLFIQQRHKVRVAANRAKRGVFSGFVADKRREIANEEDRAWKEFFSTLEKFQHHPRASRVLRSIRKAVELLSRRVEGARNKSEFTEGFKHRIDTIYERWRAYFGRTYSTYFLFLVLSGLIVFLQATGNPLLQYLRPYQDLFMTVALSIMLIIFAAWAVNSYRFFVFHFVGDVEDLLESNDTKSVYDGLQSRFIQYTNARLRRERLLSDLSRALASQYPPIEILARTVRFLRD